MPAPPEWRALAKLPAFPSINPSTADALIGAYTRVSTSYEDLTGDQPTGTGVVATTPAAASANGTAGHSPSRDDHTHRSPGGVAAITAQYARNNTATELQVVGFTLPANFLSVGTVLRARAFGNIATKAAPVGASNFNCYVNNAATLAGTVTNFDLAPTASASGSFIWETTMTCRTTGAAGTVLIEPCITINANVRAAVVVGITATATQTVDTTASWLFEIAYKWATANAANTLDIDTAYIEVVKM